ncbi:MAG: proline dehydrogenase family protein [Candidatus Promineifilaceae bacterium]
MPTPETYLPALPAAGRRWLAPLAAALAAGATAILLMRYGAAWLRRALIYLSQAAWARQAVAQMPLARRVALRFVAGESLAEGLAVAAELDRHGMRATMDYLGESVTQPAEAEASCAEIIRLLEHLPGLAIGASVSLKLTQLGLGISRQLAVDNLRAVLRVARSRGIFVRIDMEESALVDTTLELYRTLRHEDGHDNLGVVIQAYLYRSEEDMRRLIEKGAAVRLCKGAYAEPAEVAFPLKADTDANFVKLMRLLLGPEALRNGVRAALATHDEKMIAATIEYVAAEHISPADFEFQMLYGIRRELQERLVRAGYRLRIYVPYGEAWYPYFVRRLAERPANLWFFVSNLARQ